MNIVRWLLVLPSWPVGFYVGASAAMVLRAIFLQLCPAQSLVSGMCMAAWFPVSESVSFCVGAALGAAMTVLLPATIAPRYRSRVALAAFGLGVVCAISLFVTGGAVAFAPFLCALASGAVVVRMLSRE